MSKPMPVMPLAYSPPGTAAINLATQTIRRGLIFKTTSRLSGVTSAASSRTSVTFSSAGFSSMVPLQVRFKAPGTLRLSQELQSSLVTGYGETASNTWTEWENVLDCYLFGRKLFIRQGSAGALQYEVQACRRVAVSAQ